MHRHIFYKRVIPLGFMRRCISFLPSEQDGMYAFLVGEGQDGAKTRNAVIEPAEMSYKCNPCGIYPLLHFIPSVGGVSAGRGGFLLQTYKVFEDLIG
ncbi:MAG TPA: hypothetical protein PLW09_11185 [Candidatus Kapabacteria bacterium]|nr:hypothetical protein [Candidatus Kapabacteria bacterium]